MRMMSMKPRPGRRRPLSHPQHARIEGQPVAFEMWALQLDNDVAGRSAILAEHRYGGVRRVFGEVAGCPFLEQGLRPLAPRAFMTNSDGTMSTFTDDLPGADALWAAGVGVWAPAIAGIQSKPPMEIARVNRLIAQSPSNKPIHPPRAERRLRGTRRNPQDSLQCKGCIAVRLYPSDLRRSLDLVERIQ